MNVAGTIRTYTGLLVNITDLQPEDIRIEDIAHSLGMLCRYGGHCRRFYTVAEHSWLLSYKVPLEFALTALMHDSTEAYLIDLPKPVKMLFPEYTVLEHKLYKIIAKKYGLIDPLPADLENLDKRMHADETGQNMKVASTHHIPVGVKLRYWSPKTAEKKFLERFEQLTS